MTNDESIADVFFVRNNGNSPSNAAYVEKVSDETIVSKVLRNFEV